MNGAVQVTPQAAFEGGLRALFALVRTPRRAGFPAPSAFDLPSAVNDSLPTVTRKAGSINSNRHGVKFAPHIRTRHKDSR